MVVGSGAAGISAALTAAAAGLRVLMVTKDLIGGATPLAQGGLAAAIGPGDSAASHVGDTLTAGAGLCEPDVVAALADAAPGVIDWLAGLGARLDTRELRLEGGHSHHRIVHSGDDATGAEVHRALLAALHASGIEILDRTVALDLIVENPAERFVHTDEVTGPAEMTVGAGRVAGLAAGVIGTDGRLSAGVIDAPAVVIAAGGLGQAFATTSNPAGATGDGIAIAARAGAALRDLEFVQFHPTVLWLPGASGQCPLITEALRGAGAVLRDLDGTPLMAGHDPRGDLAPRDVVAARMAEVIAAGTAGHVWLDATGLDPDVLENGLPDRDGRVPQALDRPGDRVHPGRAGRALLVRRHPGRPGRAHQHPRALRGRRGGVDRGAGRQPARLQLGHRGGHRRPARGPGPRGRARRGGPGRSATPATPNRSGRLRQRHR